MPESLSTVEPAVEVPRSQERLAIAALALAAFALNLNTNVLGALLPFARTELALAEADDRYLIAGAALGSAVGALAVLPLTRWFGRRAMLVAGLVGFVFTSLLHLLADSFWSFLTLRSLSGVAVGVAYAAASALVAVVAPYERRGAAMGRFTAGMFLAIPVGMPLSVGLANAGTWRAIFGVQAAVGALGCWWALRAVRVTERPAEAVRGFGFGVLANRAVLAGLFATMLHVGSFFTTVQLATTWLDHTGIVPKEQQMLLWVGLGLASVFGSAAFGRVSDRVGKRTFVLAASIVLIVCFGTLAFEPGPVLLLLAGVLLAVTAASRTGPLQALVSGLVPVEELSALMGLRGCVMQVGVFVFALAAAPLAQQLGFSGVLLLAAGWQLLSFLAIALGVRAVR